MTGEVAPGDKAAHTTKPEIMSTSSSHWHSTHRLDSLDERHGPHLVVTMVQLLPRACQGSLDSSQPPPGAYPIAVIPRGITMAPALFA